MGATTRVIRACTIAGGATVPKVTTPAKNLTADYADNADNADNAKKDTSTKANEGQKRLSENPIHLCFLG